MYHPIGIDKLSENQLSRLRNGHSVRVKLGSHHTVHLTGHQIRRLHTAHKNGKAMTLTFDPYQTEAHGSGILGNIASKAKAFIQRHHLQHVVNPLIHGVKNAGHRTIEKITRAGHQGIKRGSHMAHSYLNQLQPVEGSGFGGLLLNGGASLANLIGGPGSGEAADVLRGIGGVANFAGLGVRKHNTTHHKRPRQRKTRGKGVVSDVLNGGASLSRLIGGPGSGEASDVLKGIGGVANFMGVGIAPYHFPRHHHDYGAGFLDDLKHSAKHAGKHFAKAGIRLGSDYLQNKIEGLGIVKPRRIVGRRRKTTKKGGALYVAGA